MKFKIRRFDLQSKIDILAGAVSGEKKNEDSALSHIMMELLGNTLFLAAANTEFTIFTEVKVDGESDGSILIESKKLLSLVKGLPDKPFTMELDREKAKMKLKVDRSQYTFSCLDRGLFPQVVMPDEMPYKIPTKFLQSAIRRCLPVISEEDKSAPYMNAAFMRYGEGKMEFVATDGNQLSLNQISMDYPKDFSCLIPRKAIAQVAASLENFSETYVDFGCTEKAAFFKVGSYIFRSSLLYGKMPNYPLLIEGLKKNNNKHFNMPRNGLMFAVKRCLIFNSGDDKRIYLDITKDEVNIKGMNTKGDYASEFIPVRTEDTTAVSLEINGTYLLNYLNSVEDDWIEVNIELAGKPIYFLAEQAHGYLYLASPYRRD